MSRRLLLLSLLILTTACACAQPGADSAVQVTDSGYRTEPANDPKFAGMVFGSDMLQFMNPAIHYGIAYHTAEDPKGIKPPQTPPEGYIGMPMPNGCNWYAGGFMDIVINGKSMSTFKAQKIGPVEQGERGSGGILWVTPMGQVRLRFLLEAQSDYLACEIALLPTAPLKDITITLKAYPSYFTAWNHKDGWRQIIGPAQMIEQGPPKPVDFAKNPWLLYQDKIFDVAKNDTDSGGPCAMALLPEQIKAVNIDPGSYCVTTTVTVKPDTRSLRFAFWDFAKKTNAESLTRLQKGGTDVIEHLRKLDFNDRNVTAFDQAAEKTAMDALIAQTAEPDKWRKTITPVFDKITTGLGALKGGDMLAEQAVGEDIGKFRDMIWDLKFDALLNG